MVCGKEGSSMIQKIQIISNNICYGPPPEHETEVEQHLTISSSGRIWFNAYNFMGGFDNYKKGRTFQKSIGKENAEKLISLIDEYTKTGPIIMATDCGSWDLKITNINKTSASFFGPLIDEIYVREIPISKTIREIIGIDDMFLFDGNYSYEDEDNDE